MSGILVISYEVSDVTWSFKADPLPPPLHVGVYVQGRVVSNIKSAGLQLSSLNPQAVAISPDTVAIRERKDEKGQSHHFLSPHVMLPDMLQPCMCLMP